MKSTNRQFHLNLDQTTNYQKMCLLNCILISIVTLTQSIPLPATTQLTRMTLTSVTKEHPKFHDTLLNPAVVPFIDECKKDVKPTQQIVCQSYFEMVKKLDASDANELSTLDDFNKAMGAYNETQIDEFCTKFLVSIPQDRKQYPESYKLFEHMSRVCTVYCGEVSDFDKILVKPICRVFATGYQLSENNKSSAQQTGSQRNNITNSQQQQVEGNPNAVSVQSEATLKSEATSDSVKQGQDISLAPASNVNDVAKKVADENVKKEKVVEEVVEENVLKENALKEMASPNTGSAAEAIPETGNGEYESKSIASNDRTKENRTPTVKTTEVKTMGKDVISSETPINNAETAEKPVINAQQPQLLEPNSANDEDKDYDDKANLKGVTDFNDNFDDVDINGKEKLVNGVDLEDGTENLDDDGMESDVRPAKNHPVQASSKAELQNEDPFTDDTDSNFFTYFMFLLLVCVVAYVVYHNKSKMLALMLEGRRSSTNGRSGLSRRKHTAAYRKLDSNLEEAITSSANGRSTQVIY